MAVFAGSPTSALAPPRFNPAEPSWRFIPFFYVHAAGTGTGEINLCALPPGNWILPANQSRLEVSTFAAGATLAIGLRACTRTDGVVLAEHADALLAAFDVASGDTSQNLPAADQVVPLATPGWVFATVAAGNIEDGDTISGWATIAPYVEGD